MKYFLFKLKLIKEILFDCKYKIELSRLIEYYQKKGIL